jgi:hypothetical protein
MPDRLVDTAARDSAPCNLRVEAAADIDAPERLGLALPDIALQDLGVGDASCGHVGLLSW